MSADRLITIQKSFQCSSHPSQEPLKQSKCHASGRRRSHQGAIREAWGAAAIENGMPWKFTTRLRPLPRLRGKGLPGRLTWQDLIVVDPLPSLGNIDPRWQPSVLGRMWREGDRKILFCGHSPACAILLQIIAWYRIGGVSELGTTIERKGILTSNTNMIANAVPKLSAHDRQQQLLCSCLLCYTVEFPRPLWLGFHGL